MDKQQTVEYGLHCVEYGHKEVYVLPQEISIPEVIDILCDMGFMLKFLDYSTEWKGCRYLITKDNVIPMTLGIWDYFETDTQRIEIRKY